MPRRKGCCNIGVQKKFIAFIATYATTGFFAYYIGEAVFAGTGQEISRVAKVSIGSALGLATATWNHVVNKLSEKNKNEDTQKLINGTEHVTIDMLR